MNTGEKLGWAGLLLLLMLPFLLAIYGRLTMGKQRYTVGVVVDIEAARAGYQPVYKYKVENIILKVRGSSNAMINSMIEGDKYLGKRHYVIFDEKHIKRSDILLDYPVPDSILSAPPNGWDSIPGVGELENPFLWSSPSPPIKKK